MHDLQKYYPQLFHEHLEHVRELSIRLLRIYLGQGKEEGIFRSDLDVEKTAAVFAFMHQELLNIFSQLREEDKPLALERTTYGVDILMRGIISEEGKRKVLESMAK